MDLCRKEYGKVSPIYRPHVASPSQSYLTKFAEIQQKKKNTEKKVVILSFKHSLKKNNLQ